jgi:hypothetical protein
MKVAKSGSVVHGTLGQHFAGVTCVWVAPKNGPACYLKTFLDGYHTKEQLVQKAGPQTRVPLARKHSGNGSKDKRRRLRAEKDVTKLWGVESHHKPSKRLESLSLTTRKPREVRL